ncbi:MAG: N-acetylmuramoyl-L-alanine amidase [Clostridia bacterium]|nr:N-acetylmuramoyl-L-alanine amidase [Clostridia bacterium]
MKKDKKFFALKLDLKDGKVRLFVFISAALFLSLYVWQLGAFYTDKTVSSLSEDKQAARALIVIDAGHGGVDGGAVSPGGTLEKDINLAVALNLRSILILNGFDVIMTRESDISIYDPEAENGSIHDKKVSDINNRIAILREHPDAILISIHQNTFFDPSVCGTQVFYVKNEQSRRLAGIMQECLSSGLKEDKQKAPKEAYDTIKLMNSIDNTGVLVECGFLSNPDDEAKLLREDYREQIAVCILNALNEFLNETGRE